MLQNVTSLSRQPLNQFSWLPKHLLKQCLPYVLLQFPRIFSLFGSLGWRKTGLGVGVFIMWGERYKICFIEGVDDDMVWGELNSSNCFHQYSIHVIVCELEGSMLSLSVHFGLSKNLLQIEVWTIIIWLVISWVTRLEAEEFDVVEADYMNGPVIEIAIMSIIWGEICIDLVCSTYSLEMHHCIHPTIPFHIPIWCILDYLVFRNVVMMILCVVFCLAKYLRWDEALAIISGEYESFSPEGWSISGLGYPYPVSSE